MLAQIALGILRHLLTAAGGALVAHGYIDLDQSSALVGALMTMIGIAWSAAHKVRQPPDPLPAVASGDVVTADDLNRQEADLLRQERR